VPAFYPRRGCHFYWLGGFRSDRFIIVFMQPPVLCKVKKIVDGVSEILFAAEIAFCRLNRCVTQQELNLLQFTAAIVAQLRASPPQVVRCNVLQACSLAAGSDHVPDNVLRNAAAPHFSPSGDRSKDFALRNPSGLCPLIESGFYPVRNGHGADVTALADQIHHSPVPLTHLDVIQPQAHKFRPAKATPKQHGEHRVVALGSHAIATRMFEHC
jgi:hypothetical protein